MTAATKQTPRGLPLADRFWPKVEIPDDHDAAWEDECWLWTAAKIKAGYGAIRVDGRTLRAHRVAYELVNGPIPDGLVLDHLCKTKACVNPAHLEPVTQGENVRRGDNATKTHCANGHERTEENTYRTPSTGWAHCRQCRREDWK